MHASSGEKNGGYAMISAHLPQPNHSARTVYFPAQGGAGGGGGDDHGKDSKLKKQHLMAVSMKRELLLMTNAQRMHQYLHKGGGVPMLERGGGGGAGIKCSISSVLYAQKPPQSKYPNWTLKRILMMMMMMLTGESCQQVVPGGKPVRGMELVTICGDPKW